MGFSGYYLTRVWVPEMPVGFQSSAMGADLRL
jgi:hypothetical protein